MEHRQQESAQPQPAAAGVPIGLGRAWQLDRPVGEVHMSQKATNEEILRSYAEHKSVWKAAKALGMCGQSVHERLVKLGANTPQNVFTDADDALMLDEYHAYRDAGKLQELADRMCRDKTTICGRARTLGLTDYSHPRPYLSVWKDKPRGEARAWLQRFKTSGKSVTEFCADEGIDDLGFSRTMAAYFTAEYDAAVEANYPNGTPYYVGRKLEYEVRDELSALGYSALRSPRSRTPIDVMATRPGSLLFIQCKNSGYMGVSEWNIFVDACVHAGATPILALRGDDGMPSYMEILGRKDGSRRRQPWTRYTPEPTPPRLARCMRDIVDVADAGRYDDPVTRNSNDLE